MDTRAQPANYATQTKGKKTACIIANAPGELTPAEMSLIESASVVIAADGAVRKLSSETSHVVVIGDFDSIDKSFSPKEAITQISKPCQETSDLEKCIQYALEQGVDKAHIVGAIGGRIDHSLVTIAMLVRYHTKLDISLQYMQSQTLACSNMGQGRGVYKISTAPGSTLSLIAWGNSSTVSLSEVAWPLERFELVCGSQGVSNSSNGTSVSLQVHSGVVICVINAYDEEEGGK